ncbi:sugar transferase [Halomicrobium salinisoli]|uniref:sugar transferase n=1 Tax=Halomicrobium salinisoli TaxID=2878391 RepID=UPI001CEFCC8C|nr:sugar transferase [Halomicrobium salinisoli]
MATNWGYRLQAIVGVAMITVLAVVVANHPLTQGLVTAVPPLSGLEHYTATNGDLVDETLTTVVIVLGAFWPLYKPRPRRILDIAFLSHKRVFVAAATLATIGYFDWSTRLPRTTLVAVTVLLAMFAPAWFLYIRSGPQSSTRAVIVGDDLGAMERLHDAADVDILGYVAPSNVSPSETPGIRARTADARSTPRSDGGQPIARTAVGGEKRLADLPRLGGLSTLDETLIQHDADTVLLGFGEPDREEFFGALATCHEHGVRAMVHRDQADSVLVSRSAGGDLIDTDLEPWDFQDYVLKRVFDVAFAAMGLLALSPLIAVVAAAIKLDSPGPVLYAQRRTAEFGDTFTVYKFRSMVPDAEAGTGAKLSEEDAGGVDPRVTSVGKVLRKTHLDEIPQLWAVLIGDMSVVGPRPERPELDVDIESSVDQWRSRWFVKPGLTGLAQINDVTGHEPRQKLRYDIEYIRKQSFWYDLKIVTRQVYQVLIDAAGMVIGISNADSEGEVANGNDRSPQRADGGERDD